MLSILINLALIPVVMFYLLRDWKMIGERLDDLVPRDWLGKVRTIARDIDVVLAEFLRGQLLVMVVLAVVLRDRPDASPDSIARSRSASSPACWCSFRMSASAWASCSASSPRCCSGTAGPAFLAVLAVYGIGQLLENYVLVPWLVGDRIGLHPLAVIFALLAFGAAVRVRGRAARAAGVRGAAGRPAPSARGVPRFAGLSRRRD